MLSEHLLPAVVWFGLAMLVVMLLLLLQIAYLRINLIARTAREQYFLQVWRPLLAAAVAGTHVTLPSLVRGDEIFFLKLWNHLQESLRGEAKTRLNALAERCGMVQYTHALLREKNLRSQLLALTTLGHLDEHSAWADILRLTQSPDSLLSFVAARALFQLDANAALNDLQQQLLAREDWPTAQLAILIQENATDSIFVVLAETAMQMANSTDPVELSRLNRLLHLLEIAPQQRIISVIRGILATTEDVKTIAQCLKFLREPKDRQTVLGYLGHHHWKVRLQAALALGRIGTVGDVPRLAELLSDPVWWVRYRTAQALVVLTRGNFQVLAELRAHLGDRYALDMLEMAMTEKDVR